MHLKKWAACLAFFLLLMAGLASAQTPAQGSPPVTYITPEAFFKAYRLPDWPAAKTPAADADLQAVRIAQAERTSTDVQEALLDASRGPVAWAQDTAGLGAGFTVQRYPLTTALLLSLHEDMRAINRAGNAERGHRDRPPVIDSGIKSIFADTLNNTASFPSARTASSHVWALLLADIFPQRRAALLAHADRTAQLRLIGGAHFPSDISAGKQVGSAYYLQISGNPAFEVALRQAISEATATKLLAMPL